MTGARGCALTAASAGEGRPDHDADGSAADAVTEMMCERDFPPEAAPEAPLRRAGQCILPS